MADADREYPLPQIFEADPDDYGPRHCVICGGLMNPDTATEGDGPTPDGAPIFRCEGCGETILLVRTQMRDFSDVTHARIAFEQVRKLTGRYIPEIDDTILRGLDWGDWEERYHIPEPEDRTWQDEFVGIAHSLARYIEAVSLNFNFGEEADDD